MASSQRHAQARFSRLNGCLFGFYSEDEILKLSTVEIKELKGLSVLSLGEPNGLHDPRMGTLSSKQQERCATCHNEHKFCPGHIGHIRLTVPIYNPAIFKFIDAILTRKCYNCHHLLFDDVTMDLIRHKLETIDKGYLFDLQSLSNQIYLLQEAHTNAMTKKLFSLDKTVKKKPKANKHKHNHESDSSESDDDKYEAVRGINIVDIPSSEEDNESMEHQNDASSKPNLDFLDAGIMRGTRQSLLQLRWRLFELIFTKWAPLDQCKTCDCVRTLFNRSDHCHIIQRPIGRRKKIYDRSGVKLVSINDTTQTIAVDKDITIPVNDVQKHLEALWTTEAFIMTRLFNTHPFEPGATSMHAKKDDNHSLSDYNICSDYKQFFIRVVVVPPNRYRPPNFLGNRIAECSQNRQFRNILKANIAMKDLIKQINELSCNPLLSRYTKHKNKEQHQQHKKKWKERTASQREYSMQSIYDRENDEVNAGLNLSDDEDDDDAEKVPIIKEKHELLTAEGLFAKYQECRKQFIQQWELLQQHYNHLTDGTKNAPISRGNAAGPNKESPGIRQLMEKKQGLFRMFMMGKRVNYAARSVVNPELWIKTNEIGIPLYAAKILTYPERVQSYNYHELRDAIINGCHVWPGANSILDASNRSISLKHKSLEQRQAIARTLLSHISGGKSTRSQSIEKNRAASRPMIVYRHIRNNDVVLVNRQPTLHKVSIMAHRVRVQHKGKVIRMHYANCNSYNADFDGDEINVHFPQSELARAEGYNVAATSKQYISVKDGSPLRGLMQDHVVASVLLTKKDTFITQNEYTQLLFCCQQTWNPAMKIRMEPPCMLKPKRLWSGKQVINSLLNGISGDLNGINMEKKTRTPANAWNGIEHNNGNKEEGMLIVRDNYICCGIIDKSQISDGQSFGLVHAIHQLYGAHATSTFLTSLGQLLSTFLQSHGFSARMEDLILTEETERKRRDLIRNSFKKSVLRCADAVGYNYNTASKPSLAGVTAAMKRFILSDESADGKLDGEMRSTLAGITNKVIGTCYPFGSKIPFPINNFQLMILAGAKGSTVNMAQIVSCLGQQELEGHRVPRMISGKTLPCFSAYAPDGRAGGFVTQRFLTGLRPQEYYFHSMAGREGLVDTACKTSRSGYLQRCLIKGMETLQVGYDNTVRDCNGNIIQFLYGEDSLDTSKASYLDVDDAKKYSFFAQNKKIIQQQVDKGMFDGDELKLIFDDRDKLINTNVIQSEKDKMRKILHGKHRRETDGSMDFEAARLFMLKWWKTRKKNEKKALRYEPCMNLYDPQLYFGSVSEAYYGRIKEFIKTFDSNSNLAHLNKNERFEHEFGINNRDFEDLMKINYVSSLVDPGEMVGILAAQSIGEPSTQMTLNTFHLAGFGDRNVTLGIPRMREILMTEGTNIKTPDMTFWIDNSIDKPMDAAIKLKNALEPLPLSKLLTSRMIQGPHVIMSQNRSYKRIYTLQLTIAVPNALKYVSVERVLRCLQKQFLPTLLQSITKNASKTSNKKIDIDESQNVDDDEYNVQSVALDDKKEQKAPQPLQDDDDDEEDVPADLDTNKQKDSDDEEYSEEEKESEIDDDESVLVGMTPKGYPTSASELDMTSDTDHEMNEKSGGMPNLVATTTDDDDLSDARMAQRNRRKKSKKRDFENNEVLNQELSAKYQCFRSVHIVMDEPRILCSLQIELPLNHEPVLLESLIDNVCRNYAFVRKISNIGAVHIQYDKNGSAQGKSNWKVIISGFNRSVLKLVDKWVDIASFESNHIAQIYKMYGIEAARNSIINELSSVLGAYGLDVSYRHLSLMADSMTFFGEIRPMTRKSMSRSTSPFLRITYEMAQKFMMDSCLNKDIDNISSPSSAIVLGQVGKFGTGLFDVKEDINELIKIQKQRKQEKENQMNESYYSDEDDEENEYDDDDEY